MKAFLAELPLVRKLFINLLRVTARDIRMTNPWTGDELLLNTYRHKGYWYYGKQREERTMEMFRRFVSDGATVVEVGGHIGFISQFFSKLAGPAGRVVVFEPGSNNLPYMEANIRTLTNVTLERIAISDTRGTAVFYEDNISGQNNSLLSDYRNATSVAQSHGVALKKVARKVEKTTLDEYLRAKRLVPDFIKIDIEGHELQALRGMKDTLKQVRCLMVEVTENQPEVSALLQEAGFEMQDEEGNAFASIPDSYRGNVFSIKSR